MIKDPINLSQPATRKKYRRSIKKVRSEGDSFNKNFVQNPDSGKDFEGLNIYQSKAKQEFGETLAPGRFRNGMFESDWNGDEMSIIGEESSADSFAFETSNSGYLNTSNKIIEDGEDSFQKNKSFTKELGESEEESPGNFQPKKRSMRYPNIFVITNSRRDSKRNSCKSVHSDDSTPHLYIDYEERLKSLLLIAFPENVNN